MSNLLITLTSIFEPENLYWDKGSGAKRDGAFWRAVPPSGFYLLGDYAQGNYNPPVGTMVVVKDTGGGGTPALAAPTGFTQVWNDKNSGAEEDGAVWMLNPPTGYVALGAAATRGYDPPPIDIFRCVRFDLISPAQVGSLIWNDQGSGAKEDVSVYAITPNGDGIALGTFYAQGNYNPPTGTVFCLPPAKISA